MKLITLTYPTSAMSVRILLASLLLSSPALLNAQESPSTKESGAARPPSWEQIRPVPMSGGLRAFWNVAGGDNPTNYREAAAHGFVTFKSGQSMSFAVSWAEMNQREEVSVVFQGAKAGGMVRRLFGTDGLDNTAIDACELYTQENGRPVNRSIVVPADETMGRVRSAVNFVRTIEGTEKPLNTPAQALSLMKLIDGAYQSAATGKPVAL